MPTSLLLLVLAMLLCRYCCHFCYYYSVATDVTLLLLLSLCCYWLPILLLLSYYFAIDTLLQILNLSRVVELTTQLLILENILWLPLCRIVTSQIFNLECYTLDHHFISYFICILVDPQNSMQLKDPRRELGISLFSYLSFLKF